MEAMAATGGSMGAVLSEFPKISFSLYMKLFKIIVPPAVFVLLQHKSLYPKTDKISYRQCLTAFSSGVKSSPLALFALSQHA
jgi:hypothetical protein